MLFQRLAAAVFLMVFLPLFGWAAQNAERARQFIVMGYQGLVQEVAENRRGAYLNTLIDLLKIPSDQQPQAIEKIEVAAKAYPNIMDFADHVLAQEPLLGVLNSTAAVSAAIPALPASATFYTGPGLENALKHLAKGMSVTVYTKSDETVKGKVADYDSRRLWLRTPAMKSFRLQDIQALEAPDL